MILSDGDIRRLIVSRDLAIEGMADPDLQIQPASVDLRLSRHVGVYPTEEQGEELDPKRQPVILSSEVDPEVGFLVPPGECVLCSTIEKVRIPPNLNAQVAGRSSIGRLFVAVHVTAGYIDPGFEGHITLEVVNHNRTLGVRLYPGMRICQLILSRLCNRALRPYGPERGSKYHGDASEVAVPVASHAAGDFKGEGS